MDYKVFDRARRNAVPVQVDLVESYVQGRISRRGFVKRGAILALSLPFMSAIISACGSDDDNDNAVSGGGTTTPGSGTSGAAGTIKQGGTLRIVAQKPAGPLDPVAMADLGT